MDDERSADGLTNDPVQFGVVSGQMAFPLDTVNIYHASRLASARNGACTDVASLDYCLCLTIVKAVNFRTLKRLLYLISAFPVKGQTAPFIELYRHVQFFFFF